jgi:hypothetical protein
MLAMRHRVSLHQAQYLVADPDNADLKRTPFAVRLVVVRALQFLDDTL